MEFGRLEKVDLRYGWQTEDRGFTPWLAQPENIEILSQEIGIDLEVQGVEQNVGPFRADILCVDANVFSDDNKHYVLIENQLEITDHKHLGQLMTYAAGLDAVTLIWIASKFTEEHRAALDWLNRITDETFRFFGIEIELYKIGNSMPAPRFNIIAKPNDWSKEIRRNTSNQPINEISFVRQGYWNCLIDFAQRKGSFLNIKPSNRTYSSAYKFGKTGFGLDFGTPAKKNLLEIYLWLSRENHKVNFDRLYTNCFQKSTELFGDRIIWKRNEEGNSSQVILNKEAKTDNKIDWENQFEWFVTKGEEFARFFKSEIDKL